MSEIQNIVDTVYSLNKNEQYNIILHITSLIPDEVKDKQEDINSWIYIWVSHVDWILNPGYRESFPKVPQHVCQEELSELLEEKIKDAVKNAMENVYIPPEYGVNPSICVRVNRLKNDFLVQNSIDVFLEKIYGFTVCAMDYRWHWNLRKVMIKNTVEKIESEKDINYE